MIAGDSRLPDQLSPCPLRNLPVLAWLGNIRISAVLSDSPRNEAATAMLSIQGPRSYCTKYCGFVETAE